jgi:hypothetical protein
MLDELSAIYNDIPYIQLNILTKREYGRKIYYINRYRYYIMNNTIAIYYGSLRKYEWIRDRLIEYRVNKRIAFQELYTYHGTIKGYRINIIMDNMLQFNIWIYINSRIELEVCGYKLYTIYYSWDKNWNRLCDMIKGRLSEVSINKKNEYRDLFFLL